MGTDGVQDPHLMSCACYAMSQLAYLSPDQVLPLVFERFQVSFSSHSLWFRNNRRFWSAILYSNVQQLFIAVVNQVFCLPIIKREPRSHGH